MKEKKDQHVAKTTGTQAKAHKPKIPKRLKETPKESIYYVSDSGCSGDCSRIKYVPFRQTRLLNIQPAPPAAQQDRVILEAELGFRDFGFNFFRTVRDLNRIGDPVGVLLGIFLDGYGGNEICKAYGPDCECRVNRDKPFDILTRQIVIPINFTFDNVDYTASYEVTMEFNIVFGTCNEPV